MIKLLKIWMITMALGGGIICVPAQTDEGQGSVDPVENESPQEQQFSNREVMNRNTALLSANLLIEQLRAAYGQKAADSDAFFERMNREPESFIEQAKASSVLSGEYAVTLREAYRKDAQTLLDQIRLRYNGDKTFFPIDFVSDAIVLPDRYVQENLRTAFPAAFNVAREKLCAQQRTKIAGSSYPSEQEVDTMSEAELIKMLEDKLNSEWRNTVFEENRGFVRESIITPIVREALNQRQSQLDMVKNTAISDAVLPEEYENLLRKTLEENIARRKANPAERKVYGLFPSVAKEIPVKAKELSANKFITTLKDFLPKYDSEQIMEELIKSQARYRNPKRARSIFYNFFKQQTLNNALGAFLVKVPELQRRELKTFLEESVINNPVSDELLTPLFEESVMKDMEKLRLTVADAQFRKYFPSLHDYSWLPPEELLREFRNNSSSMNIEEQWQYLPGLEIEQIEEVKLFDETRKIVTDAVTRQFTLAEKTLSMQLKIADDIYTRIMKQFEYGQQQSSEFDYAGELRRGLNMTQDEVINIDSINKAYTNKVALEWNNAKDKYLWSGMTVRPAGYEKLYSGLFTMTREDIELRSRALFNELEIVLPAEYGSGKNMPGLKIINCNVEVNLTDDGFLVKVASPQNPLMRQLFTLPLGANPADYSAEAMQNFRDEIVAFLTSLIVASPKDEANMIQVFIRVDSGLVPYSFVAQLRNQIRQSMRGMKLEAETSFRVVDELKWGF